MSNLNSEMTLPKNMQKQTDDDLTSDEKKAIEQYESGNEELKTYKTPQELIQDLHTEQICGTHKRQNPLRRVTENYLLC